jgi:hypothetical protein
MKNPLYFRYGGFLYGKEGTNVSKVFALVQGKSGQRVSRRTI